VARKPAEVDFYLAHPDLDGANVIVDLATFRIVLILGREGACIVPLDDPSALPRCLYNILPYDLLPRSEQWTNYNDGATRCPSYLPRFPAPSKPISQWPIQ